MLPSNQSSVAIGPRTLLLRKEEEEEKEEGEVLLHFACKRSLHIQAKTGCSLTLELCCP